MGSTAPTPGKTPDRVTESYTAGDSTVQVTAGGKTFRVTVHVQSYAQVYVDSVMQDYIAKNLPANPTDYKKQRRRPSLLLSMNTAPITVAICPW